MAPFFDHILLWGALFLLGMVLGYVLTTILIWGGKVRF